MVQSINRFLVFPKFCTTLILALAEGVKTKLPEISYWAFQSWLKLTLFCTPFPASSFTFQNSTEAEQLSFL